MADDIQMAERHALQAEQHIKRQRARIAALKRRRWPRGKASSFLQLLEDAQSIHLNQLSLLLERASRERTRAGILDLAAWFSVGSLRKPYLWTVLEGARNGATATLSRRRSAKLLSDSGDTHAVLAPHGSSW
ncbi:hypothetical protein [Mesorhizobium sp. WSM4887]|uniref:hypothetical protein n=1 Tax=Mesorhizobium sp. WSM4887 TaxID=3038543 RepID=UPI002417D4F1|nr:hypothetical protein [Mesorhizobium sp. WSM4887]MDG4888569.1 hypothetical protein [Mesorhizobium sp. WSM4887]